MSAAMFAEQDPAYAGVAAAAYAERPFAPEPNDLAELEAAASVLLLPSRHRRGELAEAWRVAVRSLGRDEPVMRFVALQAVVQGAGSVARSLPGQRERLELAHALLDAAFSDEEPRNRALAALALGRLLRAGEGGGGLAGPASTAALERGAFAAVRALLEEVFPSLRAPTGPAPSGEKAQRDAWQRAWALAALGHVMECGPATEAAAQAEVDALLVSVLEAPLTSARFLICQVLRLLHAGLRPTEGNRRRVGRFYGPVSDITGRTVPNAEPSSADGLLAEELSGFWSRWYPRPDDGTLARLPAQILVGYASRRHALIKGLPPPAAAAGISPKGRRQASKLQGGAPSPRAIPEGAPALWPAELPDPAAFPEDADDPTLTTLSDVFPEVRDVYVEGVGEGRLQFDGHSRERAVTVTSLAPGPAHFRIQVEPGRYFTAVPAYGVAQGGRGVRVTVRFEPDPEGPDPSQDVRGYLRVRTLRGFTIQRVALLACNGPLLRVVSSRLDFGFCPVGDLRADALFVRNVGTVAVNCRVVRPHEAFLAAAAAGHSEPPFNVAPLVSVLRPGELRQLRVSFEPKHVGRQEEVVTVYGAAGEAFEVALAGVGGEPLEVRDERLDFGPTSTSHDAVKELEVRNRDEANPLTVTCTCPSPAVRVAQHTVVPPGALLRIPVTFQPTRNGEWASVLTVSAPNTAPVEVALEAWAGPMLFMPAAREIFFPPCSLGEPATISLPLLSPSKYPVEFRLAKIPRTAPFRYVLWRDGEERAGGPPGGPRADGEADDQWGRCTQADMEKVKALAAPRQGSGVTMRLEITFESAAPGEFFKVPLQVELTRPYATKYHSYHLYGLCLPPTPPDDFWPKGGGLPKGYRESALLLLRGHLSDKSMHPTKLDLKKRPAGGMGATAHRVTSRRGEAITVRPAALTLFRPAAETPATGEIQLQNNTGESQGYRLLLSRPLLCERRALEGVLGPRQSLSLALTLEPGAEPLAHVGFAAVFLTGADVLQGVVTVQARDALPLAVLPEEKPIAFRLADPARRGAAHLVLESRSPAPLRWSLRMYAPGPAGEAPPPPPPPGSAATPGMVVASEAVAASLEPKPQWDFEAAEENGTLPGWGSRRVALAFWTSSEGAFHRRLRLFFHPEGAPAVCAYDTQLAAFVGAERVTVAPVYLDFGRVALGARRAGEVRASNESDVPALLETTARPPFRLAAERPLATAPPRGRLDIALHCEPKEDGEFAEPLLVAHGKGRSAVRLLCWAGTRRLASRACAHLGQDPAAALDFGLATRGEPVERILPLTNTGSLEVEVVRIESSDGAVLKWRALAAREALGRAGGEEEASGPRPDVDWDEVDFQAGVNPDEQPDDLLEAPFALPMSLPPGKTLPLLLSFCASTGGEFRPRLAVWTRDEPGGEPREAFVWQCVGSVQPPLRFGSPSVDCGLVAFPAAKSVPVEVHNPGFMAMEWALQVLDVRCHALDGAGAAVDVPPTTFTVHPLTGRLEARATATVQLRCAPQLPQHAYSARLVLLTGDGFGESEAAVQATCGSAALRLSTAAHDFGCIRIGVKKVAKVDVENDGLVEGRFEFESDVPGQRDDLFVLVPDRGAVAPKSKLAIGVHFRPPSDSKYASSYAVRWRATGAPREHAGKPLRLAVAGSGGLPQLHVTTTAVELGCILIEDVTVAEIEVHNLGAAEASAVAEVVNPSRAGANITLDPPDPFFVPAHSAFKLKVMVYPKTQAPVSASVVVRPIGEDTATTRARTYSVALKASVGAPKLFFAPSSSLPNVDFGVCRLRRPQVDVFLVENKGDVNLPFELLFVRRLPQSAAGTLRPAGRRWFRLAHELRERGNKRLVATEVESAPAGLEVPDDEGGPGSDVSGLYEAYEPGVLAITPAKGVLKAQAPALEFFVSFTPREYGAATRATLLFRNAFETRVAHLRGSGGDVLFELDTPLRALDFGRCRVGANFARELVVRNRGNLALNFYLRPEPIGGDWSQYFKEFREDEQEEMEILRDGNEDDLVTLAVAKKRRELQLGPSSTSTPASKKYQALAIEQRLRQEERRRVASQRWLTAFWERGFEADAWEGTLPPGASASLLLSFSPRATAPVSIGLRAYHTGGYEHLALSGSGGIPKLELLGSDSRPLPFVKRAPAEADEKPAPLNKEEKEKEKKPRAQRAQLLALGTVSVREARFAAVQLVNRGSFHAEFYIPEKLPNSLEITPRAGLLAPQDTAQLLVRFAPKDDSPVEALASIVWEGDPLRLALAGGGGSGVVRPSFLATRDAVRGELDFDVAPLHTALHKLFRVTNAGTVALALVATCTSAGFAIGRPLSPDESAALGYRGEALRASAGAEPPTPRGPESRRGSASQQAAAAAASRTLLATMEFGERAEARIEPGASFDIPVRILATETKPLVGVVQLESDFNGASVQLRGSGGVMRILHGGDLDFGEVAAGHSYTRHVTLYNEGTISAIASIYFLLPDYPNLRSSLVLLSQPPPENRKGPVLWRLARQAIHRLLRAHRRRKRTKEYEQMTEAFFTGRPATPTTLPAADLPQAQSALRTDLAATKQRLEDHGRTATVRIALLASRTVTLGPEPGDEDGAASAAASASAAGEAGEEAAAGEPQAAGEGSLAGEGAASGATTAAASGTSTPTPGGAKSPATPTAPAKLKSALKLRPPGAEAAARRLQVAGAAADERIAAIAERRQASLEAQRAGLEGAQAAAPAPADEFVPFEMRQLSKEEILGRSMRVPTAGPADGAAFVLVTPSRTLLPRVRQPDEGGGQSPRGGGGPAQPSPRSGGSRSRAGPEEPQHLQLSVTVRTPKAGEMDGVGWGVGRKVRGVLVVEAEVPGMEPYRIPITLAPRDVRIIADDAGPLNFGWLPLGDISSLARTFRNESGIDVHFVVRNDNPGITVDPREGDLKTGDSVLVHFVFHPLREGLTAKPIFFDPILAAPLRFKVLAGGGAYRLVCGTSMRHEFGRCMMNAWTPGLVRLQNEGNAYLPVRSIHLDESPVFKEGDDFPRGARQIGPGEHFDVPVLFNPPSEDQFVGRLVVRTKVDRFKVELTGTGRHAVLTLSKSRLDFLACVIGNVYYDSLELANVGDLQYAVDVFLKEPFPDLELAPPRLVVEAFRSARVTLTFRPTASLERLATVVVIRTPYAEMEVPVHVQAGRVELEVTPRLDFGHFQAGSAPRRTLAIRNLGDMACSWQLKRPPKLGGAVRWSRTEGRVDAGAAVDVVGTFVAGDLLKFEDEAAVTSDLVGARYPVLLCGHSDATVIRAAEFALVPFGACPVGEPQARTFVVQNYGGFPLTYTLRHVYPIKVSPLKGTVPGHGAETFTVKWVPTGGFEMHSTIKIASNAGPFDVLVTGKGAYPDFAVDPPLVPFGVVAIGFHAARTLTVRNVGLVSVEWSIPSLAAPFAVQPDRGHLEPRASAAIEVTFSPREAHRGRQGATFIVTARSRYKEVSLVGFGGVLDVRFDPPTAGLGVLPCGQPVRRSFAIENRSEVALSLALSFGPARRRRRTPDGGEPAAEDGSEGEGSGEEGEEGAEEWPLEDVELALAPAALVLGPGERGGFTLACTLRRQRAVRAAVVARAPERAWRLRVTGEGTAVTVGPLARALLDAERLPLLAAPDPLAPDPAGAPVRRAVPAAVADARRRRWRTRSSRRQLRGRPAGGPLPLPTTPVPPASAAATPTPPFTPASSRPPSGPSRSPDPPATVDEVCADVLESLLVAVAGVAEPAPPEAAPVPAAGPLARTRRLAEEARERARAALLPALPPPPDRPIEAAVAYAATVHDVSIAGLLAPVEPAIPDPADGTLRPPPPFARSASPSHSLVPSPPPASEIPSAFRPLRPTLQIKRGKR